MSATWEEVGGILRRLRKSRGMTQEQVAKRVGLSRPAISLLENGKRELNGLELAARTATSRIMLPG